MKTNNPNSISPFLTRGFPGHAGLPALTAVIIALSFSAPGSQVPNPAITKSSNPFSSAFTASNLFNAGKGEFATAGLGACSVPLTTAVTNGTWVEMDFGSNVTFDRFILATRNNASDNVGVNVLYVGTNAVHSSNDAIYTFNPGNGTAYTYHNGSAPIQTIGPVTGRYVRWECDSQPAGVSNTKNTGGRHMWFLSTPPNSIALGSPTVITNTSAPVYTTPPFNATYLASHADDGKCGNDASGEEYAINGTTYGSNNTQIVYDFGTTNIISGFDYLNREGDLNIAFNLVFSDDPSFSANIATNSWTANPTNGNLWVSGGFAPVTARFVMFQATAGAPASGTAVPNPGCREMIFYGPLTQPPTIIGQPIASTNVQGNVFSLTVRVQTNTLVNSYQWQFNGTNLSNGASFSGTGAIAGGADSGSLTLTNAAVADSGSYSVIISNSLGVVTSAVTMVTVYLTPVIVSQPPFSNVDLYAGGSNLVSVAAFGALPLSFSWYSNGTVVASTATPGFLFTNLQTNASFYGIVSNSYGRATSSVVNVTIVPAQTQPYPAAVLADHPIGFWPLNETPDDFAGDDGRTAFDYLGGNNGVYSNVVLGQQGYSFGLATQFTYLPPTDTNTAPGFGSPDYTTDSYVGQIQHIDFSSPTLAPSFSLEAWVNAQGYAQPPGAAIINKGFGGGGEQFTIDYAGGWRFYVRNTFGAAVVALNSFSGTDSFWHHLVGVMDTGHSNITIYVDGVAKTTTAYNPTNGLLSSTYAVAIGSRTGSATLDYNLNFNGNIQDVAIYNYALTASQIANHYNAAGIAPSVTMPNFTNVNEGTTLRIAATVPGTPPLAAQWWDVTQGTPGTPIANQTNTTLVISNISSAAYNNHTLELLVSNAYGKASNQVSIGIQAGPPVSVALAPTALTVYSGIPVSLSVTAQGSEPFFYQWKSNGVAVAGATNSSYTSIASVGVVTNSIVISNKVGAAAPLTSVVTGIALPADGYGLAILNDAPIAFWRLDEPTNAIAANDYAGGHTALYINATNGLPGFNPLQFPLETAAGFGMNGFSNDSLALENDNTSAGIPLIDFSSQGSNAQFTIEAWVKALGNQSGAGGGIVTKGYGGGGEQFCIDTGTTSPSSFRFFVRTVGGAASVVNSTFQLDGNWHHVVGVCDQAAGTLKLYGDGGLAASSTIPSGLGVESVQPNVPVSIGSRDINAGDTSFTDQLINGVIADVAIYKYPLTASQVAAHYSAAQITPAVSLTIAYLPATQTAVLSWPSSATGFVLQQTSSLPAASWVTVTNAVNATNGFNQVAVPATSAAQFYRLLH
jgi:hypothetical protein